MNDWQVAQQIQYLLRTLTWADSPYEPVFAPAAVLVSGGISTEQLAKWRRVVLIAPAGRRGDPQLDGLATSTWSVRIASLGEDDKGEMVLLGGNRKASGGQGSSQGRGLLEVEAAVLDRIERLNDTVGVRIGGGFVSAADASYQPDAGYVVDRVLTFEVDSTTQAYYHEPRCLVATPAGGGTFRIDLTWELPPSRFDFHAAVATPSLPARGRIIVRRRHDLTAPTGPTDGVDVPLSGDFATSVSDTVSVIGGAFYTYGIFAAYDEASRTYGQAGNGVDRYSDPFTHTKRTVQAS